MGAARGARGPWRPPRHLEHRVERPARARQRILARREAQLLGYHGAGELSDFRRSARAAIGRRAVDGRGRDGLGHEGQRTRARVLEVQQARRAGERRRRQRRRPSRPIPRVLGRQAANAPPPPCCRRRATAATAPPPPVTNGRSTSSREPRRAWPLPAELHQQRVTRELELALGALLIRIKSGAHGYSRRRRAARAQAPAARAGATG